MHIRPTFHFIFLASFIERFHIYFFCGMIRRKVMNIWGMSHVRRSHGGLMQQRNEKH